jgi:hypothetical protein
MEIRPSDMTIEQFKAVNEPSHRLSNWAFINAELTRLKALEAEARKVCVDDYFAQAKEGTNNADLGNGYTLKAVVKNNYRLAANDKVDDALAQIEKLGEKGKFLAERVVRYKPDLSLTEYKNLDLADNVDKAVKDIIDGILTIQPGMPSLEIVPPKTK